MAKPEGWRFPSWEDQGNDFWLLTQIGVGTVGEVYRRDDGVIKWHCKTSDWRDISCETISEAKAACEASFWKEAWHKAVGE